MGQKNITDATNKTVQTELQKFLEFDPNNSTSYAKDLILSSVYTDSIYNFNRFRNLLDKLYDNPFGKIEMDIIALNIIHNSNTSIVFYNNDDFANELIYQGNDLYFHDNDKDDETGLQTVLHGYYMPPLLWDNDSISPNVLFIGSNFSDDNILNTVSHECAHYMANLLFQNASLPNTYSDSIAEQEFSKSYYYLVNLLHGFLSPRTFNFEPKTLEETQNHLTNFLSHPLENTQQIKHSKSALENQEFISLQNLAIDFAITGYQDWEYPREAFARLYAQLATQSEDNISVATQKFATLFNKYFTNHFIPQINSLISTQDPETLEKLDFSYDFIMKVTNSNTFGKEFTSEDILTIALIFDQVCLAKSVFSTDIDLHKKIWGLYSPIEIAVCRNHKEFIDYIIENNAFLDIHTDGFYGDLLELAHIHSTEEIYQTLLNYEITHPNPNAVTDNNNELDFESYLDMMIAIDSAQSSAYQDISLDYIKFEA